MAAADQSARGRHAENLVGVLTMVVRAALWLGVGLMALTIVFPSVTPAKALATLSLGSVAIGFAFKDTFENFLAGILILLREPFEIGDHIATDSVEGQIETITVRDTRIRKTDGQLIVVPNSHLFSSPVTVRTSQQFRRTEVNMGIAYGEDVDAARQVIEEAVHKVDSVRAMTSATSRSLPRRSGRLPSISRLPGGRDRARSIFARLATRSWRR